MSGIVTGVLDGLLAGGVLGSLDSRRHGRVALASALTALTAVTAAALSVTSALRGDPASSAAWAGIAVIWAWLWWRGRGKRRERSLKALGNKARARLAAMARNMPKPGPVLRPVPQGG